MNERNKILFITGQTVKNKKFFNCILKEYKVDICNQVVSSYLEKDLSTLKYISFLHSQFPYFDLYWEDFLSGISETEFAYKYGFDDDTGDFEMRKLIMGDHLRDFLYKTGYQVNKKASIAEVVSEFPRKKNVVQERDIFKYDLIIVEELVTKFVEVDVFKISQKHIVEYPYIRYTIPLSCLRNYLKMNGRVLFLMDDLSAFDINRENTMKRFSSAFAQIARIEFSDLLNPSNTTININRKEQLISIPVTEIYKNTISSINLGAYPNVRTINLISPYSIKIADDKKGFGKGNNAFTGNCILITYTRHNDFKNTDNGSDINSNNSQDSVSFNTGEGYVEKSEERIAGIYSIKKRNCFCILTGNILSDRLFANSNNDNRKFALNIINKLLSKDRNIKRIPEEYLPNVKIVIKEAKVIIEKKQLPLTPMEYCYYRYFLEKAKKGEKEKIGKVVYTPDQIRNKVLSYYKDSFPEYYNLKLDKILRPKITDMRSNISRIKKKVMAVMPKKYDGYYNLYYIDNHSVGRSFSLYGIGLPPEKILIVSND